MRPKSDLRGYQNRVVTKFYESDELLAVLKMGAGKTVAALTAIDELIRDDVIRHALIIAPKRVATITWPGEVKGWEHTCGLPFTVLEGSPVKRATLLHAAQPGQLTIVGIDNVQWLVDELAELPADHLLFDCLVIDETSRLKDPKSKRAKALAKIAGRFKIRWGLTGTPAPNSLLDLFTPAKILTNGKLWGKSFYKWQRERFYPIDRNGYNWRVLPGQDERIQEDIASISFALGDNDMPDLPELSILIDEVKLPDDARVAYRDMERKLLAEVAEDTVLAASQAVATGKLAQMANGFVYGEGGNTDVSLLHSEKATWLEELVAGLDGEPVILVYEYREDLALIRRLFGNIPYLGAGVTDKAAQAAVEAWNRGELPLFALHPASGGHGLNLQAGGSRMAWLSPTWSAELWDQTLARLHRPGQAGHVMVHVCCAVNTVDELKRLRVIGKLEAQQAFERYLSRAAGQSAAAAAA